MCVYENNSVVKMSHIIILFKNILFKTLGYLKSIAYLSVHIIT